MSPIAIGLALGLFVGIAQFVALRRVIAGLRGKAPADATTDQKARLLGAVAWLDLALLPALGGLLGMTMTNGGFAP